MAHQAEWPSLRVGRHLTSDDGACLMELVSVAAGEPWSDHPACTHPLLSHVARRVNDATSDRHRAALIRFVPALAQATSDDPRAFAGIAASCTGVALEDAPSVLLRTLNAAAVRRTGSHDTRRHPLYVHGTAFRSVDLAVLAVLKRPQETADLALRRMLSASLLALPVRHPLPDGLPRAASPRSLPRGLTAAGKPRGSAAAPYGTTNAPSPR